MPAPTIKRAVTPPAAAPADDSTSLIRQLLAGGIRGVGGFAAGIPAMEPGPGSALGAAIGGGTEALAEGVEQGTVSPKLNMARVGTEAALGAVPGKWLFAEGRPLLSALRGALFGGGSTAARELSEGQTLDPKAIGTSAALSGGLGGLLGVAFPGKAETSTPTVSPTPYGPPTQAEANQAAAHATVARRTAQMAPQQQKRAEQLADQMEVAYSKKQDKLLTSEQKAATAEANQAIKDLENERRAADIKQQAADAGLVPGKIAVSEGQSAQTPEGTISLRQGYRRLKGGKAPVVTTPPAGPIGTLAPEEVVGLRQQGYDDATIAKIAQADVAKPTPVPVAPAAPATAPTATYAFDQPGVGPMFTVEGGPSHGSTVSAGQLTRLGIPVPELPKNTDWIARELADVEARAKAKGVTESEAPFAPGLPKQIDEVSEALGKQPQAPPKAFGALGDVLWAKGEQGAAPVPQTAQDVTGQAYRQAQAAHTAGEPVNPLAPRYLGASLTRPDKVEQFLNEKLSPDIAQRVSQFKDDERGAISNLLLMRLGLGAAGAFAGSALSPQHQLLGALIGGTAGALSPSLLSQLSQSASIADSDPEHLSRLSNIADQVINEIPHMTRFNLLATLPGLTANALVGPWGSAIMGSLEHMLAGDARGANALRELINPTNFAREYLPSIKRASDLIARGEGGRAELNAPGWMGKFAKMQTFPGVALTAGDEAARAILQRHGFNPDEARRITLTSQPWSKSGANIVNFVKGSPLLQVLAPFTRTPANILEQGIERTPFLGEVAQSFKTRRGLSPDPANLRAVQQLLGGAVGLGSGALGYEMDPSTDTSVRRYLTNFAGPYSLPATVGLSAGQALRAGQNPIGAGIQAAYGRLPLPTTRPLSELSAFLNDPSLKTLPPQLIPAFVREKLAQQPLAKPRTFKGKPLGLRTR